LISRWALGGLLNRREVLGLEAASGEAQPPKIERASGEEYERRTVIQRAQHNGAMLVFNGEHAWLAPSKLTAQRRHHQKTVTGGGANPLCIQAITIIGCDQQSIGADSRQI
jgi:hypothetical protein